MLKELDSVILTEDLPEYRLQAGDIGTIVLVHGDHEGYEVEFVTLAGETVALISVYAQQVRPASRSEIPHARTLNAA